MIIPKSKFKFRTPDFWKTGEDFAGHPEWDINIFLVANAAGLNSYNPSELRKALSAALPGVIVPSMPQKRHMLAQLPSSASAVHLSRRFRKAQKNIMTDVSWNSAALQSDLALDPPRPLAFADADAILYTDGSVVKTAQGQSTGAGVYCKSSNINLTVDPCGISATNTITRAELVAIYAALQQSSFKDVKIATDSLASMFSINRALKHPANCTESPHKTLLLKISQLILARSQQGLKTDLLKVKSHTGIEGNEKADRLANAARDPSKCQIQVDVGNIAFADRLWPSILKARQHSQGAQLTWHTAANLHASIRDHVAAKHAKGLTPAGQYYSYWQHVLPELHASSFAFWKNARLPFRTKVNLLKARWGQLWTMNMAYKQQRSYHAGQGIAANAQCPLCRDQDGISHMLGGCSHPTMKAMYIERHNQAARKILKLIIEGAHGNCYMLADVGSETKLGNLGALDSRLPHWLVTDTDLNTAGATRTQLRPDIMITNARPFELQDEHDGVMAGPHAAKQARQGSTVWIVEVGYCAATRYHDKLVEKQQQHEQLISILEGKGYTVHLLPVLLGTTGEIFKSTLKNIKLAGADNDRVDRTASRLSLQAQESMQGIIQFRRVTEGSNLSSQQSFRPP